jgi:hypothetical protein
MADYEKDEFKFPDEIEMSKGGEVEDKLEIEIEDDTPEPDRGREPMPKEVVDELENDELEEYSDKVKVRLKQMKKVWHDERRAKESAYREQQEAVEYARKVSEENKRLRAQYSAGEQEYVNSVQSAASMELEMAKKAYKEAYDSGDGDKLVDAQQAMQDANFKLHSAKNFRPTSLQQEESAVQQRQEQQQPVNQPDRRAMAWQERNTWFGQDEEMTAAALGLHEKLKRNGVVVGSDDYYATLDKTMRRRFSENFEDSEPETKASTPRTKSGTVVASAARSTSPNKVRLKASQIQLAKKLGLTPEQYAREAIKLEAQ